VTGASSLTSEQLRRPTPSASPLGAVARPPGEPIGEPPPQQVPAARTTPAPGSAKGDLLTTSPARTTRLEQVDIARGLAVIGVVLNHAVDGLVGASLVPLTSTLARFNDALYIFRMPTLALLLGLFIPLSLRRRSLGVYIRQRALLFGYLYVVWFFLQSAVEVLTSGLRNSQSGLASLVTVWNPPAHLWFIPFLVVASITVGWLAPWRRELSSWLGLAALALLSVLTWGWNPSFIGLRGLSLLFFVALGATIQVGGLGAAFRLPVRIWLLAGPVALAAFYGLWRTGLAPASQEEHTTLLVVLRSEVAALLGVVLVLFLAVALARLSPLRRLLAAVGRRTLPIYLAHVMVVAGGRIVLDKVFQVGHVWAYPTVLVPAGVVLPLLLAAQAQRLHLSWLFQLPSWLVSRPSRV
jgi:fucose 4-O-acetylase-like acetyltransferase